MTSRQRYDQQIAELKQSIVCMAGRVQEAIGTAEQAFVQLNPSLLAQIVDRDATIDELEMDIQHLCSRILATEQPVARDLRTIVAALAISNDLERMGNYTVHLAKIASSFSHPTAVKVRSEIGNMADITTSMIRDATTAFLEEDYDLAREVQRRDFVVDGIYASFVYELMQDMSGQRCDVQQTTALLFYSKSLERLADHTTNICKEVIYVCTGAKVQLLQ